MGGVNSPMWRVRRSSRSADELGTNVFVAPGLGRTFQLTGTLRLNQQEHDDLDAKLTGKEEAPAVERDLNAEEYNSLMEFLLEWADHDLTALKLADMVRRKFGASTRRAEAKEQAGG